MSTIPPYGPVCPLSEPERDWTIRLRTFGGPLAWEILGRDEDGHLVVQSTSTGGKGKRTRSCTATFTAAGLVFSA